MSRLRNVGRGGPHADDGRFAPLRPHTCRCWLVAFVVLLALVGPLAAPHAPHAFVGFPPNPPPGPSFSEPTTWATTCLPASSGRSDCRLDGLCRRLPRHRAGCGCRALVAYSRLSLDDRSCAAWTSSSASRRSSSCPARLPPLGAKLWLIVLLVVFSWCCRPPAWRRGITSEVVHREYAESAEIIGLPRWRILVREILNERYDPLMVEYGLRLTWSIALIAAVSFLGFGIQPPNADGIDDQRKPAILTTQPWAVSPALCS